MQKAFRCPIQLQQVVLPHNGKIKSIAEYKNNSYLLIETPTHCILLCVASEAKWHLKIPFQATHLESDHNGLYVGGIRYTNAQKIDFNSYIICFSHRGRMLWKYAHPNINEELWALLPLHDGAIFCLMVTKTSDDYRLRHMCIYKQPLWQHVSHDIQIQSRFFHHTRIPPKLILHNQNLLSLGAYQFPQSPSAVSFFVFERHTGNLLHTYKAPHPNAYYIQSALSLKGHLAIAWQTYRQQLPHTHLLLFNTQYKCIGEYHSYLHCWLGLHWSEKSLLLTGKSRDTLNRPSIESVGKDKFFHEYTGEELIGQMHLHNDIVSYQNKTANNIYELVIRLHDGTRLQTFSLESKIPRLFTSSSAIAYEVEDTGIMLIKPLTEDYTA